jgi:hypothetical protein
MRKTPVLLENLTYDLRRGGLSFQLIAEHNGESKRSGLFKIKAHRTRAKANEPENKKRKTGNHYTV